MKQPRRDRPSRPVRHHGQKYRVNRIDTEGSISQPGQPLEVRRIHQNHRQRRGGEHTSCQHEDAHLNRFNTAKVNGLGTVGIWLGWNGQIVGCCHRTITACCCRSLNTLSALRRPIAACRMPTRLPGRKPVLRKMYQWNQFVTGRNLPPARRKDTAPSVLFQQTTSTGRFCHALSRASDWHYFTYGTGAIRTCRTTYCSCQPHRRLQRRGTQYAAWRWRAVARNEREARRHVSQGAYCAHRCFVEDGPDAAGYC